MGRTRLFARWYAAALAGILVSGALVVGASPAGALQGPGALHMLDWTQTTHVVCRANASVGGNQESDQDLDYTISAPSAVTVGTPFDVIIKPGISIFPAQQDSPLGDATVNIVRNLSTRFQMPLGVTINSVANAVTPGSPVATPTGGYFVAAADVPDALTASTPTMDPDDWHPLDLDASKRLAIPGGTSAAVDTVGTNVIKTKALGTGSGTSGNFPGGSAMQPPWIRVNMTATAAPGTDLTTKLAGSVPNALPASSPYTVSSPGNEPGPTFGADPTVSTNWPNATFTTTAVVNIILTVTAPTACAPGYENVTSFPTPPAYMTGPGALANGVAPPISHTLVVNTPDDRPPEITIDAPVDNGAYTTGEVVNSSFDCNDYAGSGDDVCTADNDGNPILSGAAIDTTDGPHTLTVHAKDLNGNETTSTHDYTVAANQNPTANAGPNQSGKVAGNTITLDATGSTDPDGPPAQTLTYTWAQVANGAPTVTLSSASAAKPTFTVPPVDNPAGYSFQFTVTADDGHGGTDTSGPVTIAAVASTPTVTVSKAGPNGATFYPGTTLTLSAAITNPDGNAEADYTYAWSQNTGITTTLTGATTAHPTFVVPLNGNAACTSGTGATNCPTFKVIVTKTSTNKSSASANLANWASTVWTRPTANAGPAQNRGVNRTVTLNGTGSAQAQGHAVTYAWTQTSGTSVTGDPSWNPAAAQPTFTTPATSGTLGFSLVVTDPQNPITGNGTGGKVSTAATTTVTVTPDHVVASAGPNQTGKVAGNTITLDATASTDPDNLPLTYTWTQVANGAPTVGLSNIHAAQPTFVAPPVTVPAGFTFQFNLTATNGGADPEDTDTTVTPVSIAEVASTPTVTVSKSPTSVFTGDTVTLSANITNPDGTAEGDYSYVWTQAATGIPVTLNGANTAHPTFIVPPQTNLTTACTSGTSSASQHCPRFTVVVTKTNTAKASTAATLAAYASTLATRPVANAGTPQTVKVGTGVTLSGSGTQAQGHPFTYAWTQTAGPTVSLSSTGVASPTFTASNTPTSYTFSLVVTDTPNASTTRVSTASTVTITVADYASPAADAGPAQNVKQGASVSLDATASTQADGHTLSYSWAQTDGTTVSLSGAGTANPTFTAPLTTEALTFRVTVTDTQNPNPAAASSTADVVVNVAQYASPVASAGPPQTVLQGDHVTLDSTGSAQEDGHTLTYSWTQVGGTGVSLSGAGTAHPTFTAPLATGPLTFRVTATDTQNPNAATASNTADVVITVSQYANPVANAGPAQSNIDIGKTVTLDGSASSQANGHPLTYQWTQTGGTAVTLVGPTTAKPKFVAPTGPVTLTFRLVVNDGFNASAPATVTVKVNGIHGLNLATALEGTVAGEDNASKFKATVVNTGTLNRAVSSSGVAVTITRNGVAVSASTIAVAAKSVTINAGKSSVFNITWNHGQTLHAGDIIVVKACVNQVGDENPGNNCGTVNDPPGRILASAAPKPVTIKAATTSTPIPVTFTNSSAFKLRPIRMAENIKVTVTVGTAAPQTAVAMARDPLALAAGATTNATFTWTHATLKVGATVTIKVCAVVTGNQATAPCGTGTAVVK